MTIIFAIMIYFVFVKVAFNAVDGYLIHYATFMASRTYMVADINGSDIGQSVTKAESEARKTFSRFYINLFGYDESGLQFNSYNTDIPAHLVGCYFEFEQKFSILRVSGPQKPMHLKSESFLGKEPPKQECIDNICSSIKGTVGTCGKFTTYFDNGC